EYRFYGDHSDALPALAVDLARRPVNVIVASNTQAALAAKAATRTVPIVFQAGADPVKLGLVVTLNRPGGNLTGFAILNSELAAKRLQLLHELSPTASSIAFLSNPSNPALGEAEISELQPAAQSLGVRLVVLSARDRNEIAAASAVLLEKRV